MAEWKTVRANIDYHVEIDRHYYSVPYQLAGQQLEARYTATTVEIFHLGKRVASHGAARQPTGTRPFRNICRRAIRPIWSGRLRA